MSSLWLGPKSFIRVVGRSRSPVTRRAPANEENLHEHPTQFAFSNPGAGELRNYLRLPHLAAQQLFGSGVKLRPGQNIEYVITNAEAHVPNDRVRAYALWEGWFGCDRKKYASMLHEAFEPFVLCIRKRAEPVLLCDSISEDDLKRFPLFAFLKLPFA